MPSLLFQVSKCDDDGYRWPRFILKLGIIPFRKAVRNDPSEQCYFYLFIDGGIHWWPAVTSRVAKHVLMYKCHDLEVKEENRADTVKSHILTRLV